MAPVDPETEERLKSALWYSIGQLIDHETLSSNTNATPQFIVALMEIAWSQIENSSKDLESFAKHAGRTQINADDVLLLARRNEGLESLLRTYVEELRKSNGGGNAKGKARAGGRK